MTRDDIRGGVGFAVGSLAGSGSGGAVPGAGGRRAVSNGVDPRVLAEAQALIDAMRSEYLAWAADDLSALFTALETLEAGRGTSADANAPADFKADPKADLFRIAHDMKGQGGSFGYDLVTTVGNHLCRFLERTGTPLTADQLAAVRAHAESLRTILTDGLMGDGGEVGADMLARLETARTRALS